MSEVGALAATVRCLRGLERDDVRRQFADDPRGLVEALLRLARLVFQLRLER